MGYLCWLGTAEAACRGAHRHLILLECLRPSPHNSLQDELAAAPDLYDGSHSKLSQDSSAVSGSKGSLAEYYYAKCAFSIRLARERVHVVRFALAGYVNCREPYPEQHTQLQPLRPLW